MKKLVVLLFIVLVLASCELATAPQPPGWIHGTWSDIYHIATWTFTSNNAIWTTGTITLDFRNSGVNISDSETATTYSLSWEHGGIGQTHTFTRGDGTAITWNFIGGMTLLRQ